MQNWHVYVAKCEKSITGDYLSGRKTIEVPKKRREGNGNYLRIIGARENNLKNIDLEIPRDKLVVFTGLSGSGKSSLVNGIIHPVLADRLNNAITYPGKHDRVEGIEHLDKVIDIDQSPIGRTPRSNPATYTGVFTDIRDLFSSTTDAKKKGYKNTYVKLNAVFNPVSVLNLTNALGWCIDLISEKCCKWDTNFVEIEQEKAE